jgi:thiosulfate dehydrogenase [quinone] large subunit
MEKPQPEKADLGATLGFLLARLWLALRSLQTGIEKFAGMKSSEAAVTIDGAPNTYGLTEATATKGYALSSYQGVPKALYDKFAAEPLIPGWFLGLYDIILGPALILLGLTLLLGIATRISLFAMGLLYTSLTFGLILLKQDAGVAWLAAHVILIVMALALAKHNRFAILNKW